MVVEAEAIARANGTVVKVSATLAQGVGRTAIDLGEAEGKATSARDGLPAPLPQSGSAPTDKGSRDVGHYIGSGGSSIGARVPGTSLRALEAEDERLRDLMVASLNGDELSYARLLSDSEPVIRRAVRRTGARPDWIDDIVQDSLLTIHQARRTYDPSRSFTVWLNMISTRRAIDAMRRHRRRSRREVHSPTEYERHADPGADTSKGWREAVRAEAFACALEDLPKGQRQAVDLIAMQGQSLAEAAASTGRSKGALKVDFHRALTALKTRLGRG